MARITADHVFSAHLGVMLDGQVVEGMIVEADSTAGTVTYYAADHRQHTGERITRSGVVRFFPASPYIKIADLAQEFPELAGVLVENPNIY